MWQYEASSTLSTTENPLAKVIFHAMSSLQVFLHSLHVTVHIQRQDQKHILLNISPLFGHEKLMLSKIELTPLQLKKVPLQYSSNCGFQLQNHWGSCPRFWQWLLNP